MCLFTEFDLVDRAGAGIAVAVDLPGRHRQPMVDGVGGHPCFAHGQVRAAGRSVRTGRSTSPPLAAITSAT
jgi:hypothetical protein